jgi:hypothetical protein
MFPLPFFQDEEPEVEEAQGEPLELDPSYATVYKGMEFIAGRVEDL